MWNAGWLASSYACPLFDGEGTAYTASGTAAAAAWRIVESAKPLGAHG